MSARTPGKRTFDVLVIFLFCIWSSASSANNLEKSIEYYDDAKRYLEQGENEAAIIQLKNAVAEDPDHVEARLLLAQLYIWTGYGREAEWELRAAMKRGVLKDRVLVALGQSYALQGRNEDVLEEIRSEDEQDEQHGEVLLIRASAALRLGRYDEAQLALHDFTALHPDDPRGYLGLARLRIAQRRPIEANDEVDEALLRSPDLLEAMILRGDARRLSGDAEGALDSYRQAVEKAPNNLVALERLATARVALGYIDAARQNAKSIEEVAPGHPIVEFLDALILAKEGNYADALDTLRPVAGSLENFPPAIYLLGVVGYATGDLEVAEEFLAAYLDTDSDHLEARKLLAAVQLRKEQPESALSTLGASLSGAVADPQAFTLAAMSHLQSGRLSKATTYFEKAASVAPDDPRMLLQFALNLISVGEPDRAITQIKSLLDLQPGEVGGKVLLVLANLSAGEYDDALAASDDLRGLLPESALAEYLNGQANAGKGDYAAARERYQHALSIDPDYLQALLSLADLDLREGLSDRATSGYGKVLEKHSENAQAMNGLAKVAILKQNDKEALDWFDRARRANDRDLESRLSLIELYLGNQQVEKALVLVYELERIAPSDNRVLDAQGRLRLATGEYESAIASFEHLLKQAPELALAHFRLAQALIGAGRQDEARERLVEAAALAPQSEAIHALLVSLELQNDNPDEALKIAQTFRDREPDRIETNLLLAEVLLRSGELNAAIEAVETAWNIEQTPGLAVQLSRLRARAGQVEEAVGLLESWLLRRPESKPVRRALAEILLQVGQRGAAIAQFEALLASDSEDAVVLNNLAWLYHEKRDGRAVRLAQKALALAPDQPAILDTLGWILVNQGEAAQGLGYLRKARMGQPQDPEIHFHLAVGLHQAGFSDEAFQQLKELLDAHQEFRSAPDAQALLDEISNGS